MRRAAAVLCIALLLTGCGEEVEVRVSSRLFPDLGLQRTVRVDARAPQAGEESLPAGWLRSGLGLVLAAPGAWDRVDEHPSGLRAEGFFAAGERVPPILAHRHGDEERADRSLLRVAHDDLVVLDRFVFEEMVGDPFGPQEMGTALDAVLAPLAERLAADLHRQFGEEIATRRLESFLRKDARAALLDLLDALRRSEAPGSRSSRAASLAAVRARHRLPVQAGEDPQDLEQDVLALVERATAELARANPRLPAAELRAFVAGEEGAILRGLEGPALAPAVEALLVAYYGAYGRGARVRFVARIELPGRILRTGGTVDGQAAVFSFDHHALTSQDVVLSVESVDLDDEALRRLGARRELEAAALLRAVDLLTREDLAEPLRAALRRAVEQGSLAALRESGDEARELAELLDPEATWPPP